MARKNSFQKTKYKNIVSLENANGKNEFFANFMLDGVSYQKKNLTKLFGSTTAKKASDMLEEIKSDIRNGKNPFSKSGGSKVKDIILKSIEDKKSDKDNSKYKKNLTTFYNLHIDPVIGHLKLDKVKDTHINKIFQSLEGSSKTHKLNLNVLMFKIFETEFRNGNISMNPFYGLEDRYGNHKKKANFDTRLNEPKEDAVRKLFNTALEFGLSHRLLFTMSIMLARRIGELYKLRCSHIKRYSNGEWYILTTADITKTGIDEKFPLPIEVVELLPEFVLDDEYKDELLFSFCYSGMFLKWQKLVKDSDIQLNDGYKITTHDSRYFFISILTSLKVDSDVADRCLSHENKKNIKQIYLDVDYATRKETFERWWDFLRG